MGFTYLDGSNLPLHQVRARIGDTDANAVPYRRLEDEDILARIAEAGTNLQVAALNCLDELLARYAREADAGPKAAGLEATRRFERLKDIRVILAEQVSRQAGPSTAMISQATRTAQLNDADFTGHPTREGAFDYDPG